VKNGDGLFRATEECSSVTLHIDCRKKYTRPRKGNPSAGDVCNVESSLNTSVPRVTLRSGDIDFDIKRDCIFCGEEASASVETKRHAKYRREIYEIRTIPSMDAVIDRGLERKDEWGDTVAKRAQSAFDLVAAEAVYHKH